MKNIKYLPLFFFSAFGLKALLVHPSVEECLITLAMAAMAYGYEFFASENKLNELNQHVITLSTKIDELEKKNDNVQTQISSMKLSGGMRTQRLG